MKICIAQTKPRPGNIAENIERHQAFVHSAIGEKADLIIFPELSLTGYEPTLANSLAMDISDNRLDVFREFSDKHEITIGVGAPTKNKSGICISMILFHPGKQRTIYSKHYLHEDEKPYFIPGANTKFPEELSSVSLAICYELSVPEHAEEAAQTGSSIYLASVAKTARGVESAHKRLTAIARNYAMTVLMSNAVGPADGDTCAGQSAIWDRNGQLVDQLDEVNEGLLILDTEKATTRQITLK